MISILKAKTFIFIWAGVFIYFFMLFNSVIIQSFTFFIFCLFIMNMYSDKGILHPFSWFPILFFLYSVSYPLYLTIYTTEFYGNVDQVVPLCFMGLLSFMIGFNFFSNTTPNYDKTQFQYDDFSLRFIGWILILSCNLLNLIILFSGISTKREYLNFIESNGIATLFTIFFILALVCALILKNTLKRINKIEFDFFQIFSIITFLISFGLTGERDLLFRYILLISFIMFTHYLKYKPWKLTLGLLVFVFVLPVTQQMKSFFVSSESTTLDYQPGDFLNSEFASAGRNILYLFDRNITGIGWEIFIKDIYRFFSFLGTKSSSATVWFNEVIRNQYGDGGTSGWGFSMIGEGYLSFGVLGVIILFIFLGAVTALMYGISDKKFFFCMYLLYIPVMIYVIRADLSNFLSLNFKVNLFMVSVLFTLMYFLNKVKNLQLKK